MSKSKKHQRTCPVLGREISSAECGSGRGSLHACPADCPHFPFTPATYDQHVEIETRLIRKLFERATKQFSEKDQKLLHRRASFVWMLHGRRDPDGLTFGERLLADKSSGLNNDERVLLTGMNQVRPVVFEVHRIIDAQTIEGVDLLDGSPVRVVDRAMAKAVGRYCALLSWFYPMPHYHRDSAQAVFIPSANLQDPAEIVRGVIQNLGGAEGATEERAWLAEHFHVVSEALQAMRDTHPEASFWAQPIEPGTSPSDTYRQRYAGFLDEPEPALEGLTPRSAATDPALRSKLMSLMKAHIRACDAQRCKHGLDVDLNPLLAELGLHEMISTPPPLGDALDEIDEIDEIFATLPDFGMEEGPFEVIAPLSPEEVEERFTAAQARYPDPADALEDMEVFFPALLDMCWDATKSTLKENGWIALELLITRACLLLRPEPEGPEFLNMDRILAGFAREFRGAAKTLSAPEKGGQVRFEHWLGNSPQPAVMDDLSGALAMICEKSPRKERPRDEEVLVIIAFLKSIVMELARERDA